MLQNKLFQNLVYTPICQSSQSSEISRKRKEFLSLLMVVWAFIVCFSIIIGIKFGRIMQDMSKNQEKKKLLVALCNDIDNLHPLIQNFQGYFSNLDGVLYDTNENQESILRKKYRYFLTKLNKLQQVESSLQQKFDNLDDFVDNSAPVRQEKTSIAFIEMISSETLKKLGVLGIEVQEAKQIKKENEKKIIELKGKINKLKSIFFELKKEQITLMAEFQKQKEENLLVLADNKFRRIVKQKNQEKMKKTMNNIFKITKQKEEMRFSQGFQWKNTNEKIGKSSSNFYPTHQKRNILTTLDQINIVKQSLINQVEKLQESKQKNHKKRYEELINNWDAKFKTNGIRWWIDKSKNRKKYCKEKENVDEGGEKQGQMAIFSRKKVVRERKFSKKDCQGCEKRQEQLTNKNKQKFQLLPKPEKPENPDIFPQNSEKNLLPIDKKLQNQRKTEQANKKAFLELSPQEIIKLVSKKNKIYELSKLIELNFSQKLSSPPKFIQKKTRDPLRC